MRPLFCGFLQRPPLGIMFSRLYVGANSGFITVRGSCYDKGNHRPFCLGLLLRAASRTSLGDYAFAFIRALVNVSKIFLYCFLRDDRLSLCFYCSGVYRDHRPFVRLLSLGFLQWPPLGIMFSRLCVGANSGFITVRGLCYHKSNHRPFCLGLLFRAFIMGFL